MAVIDASVYVAWINAPKSLIMPISWAWLEVSEIGSVSHS